MPKPHTPSPELLNRLSDRTLKLVESNQRFIVIADDEPYFEPAYRLIRSYAQSWGTWTPHDELAFRATIRGALDRVKASPLAPPHKE